MAPTLDFRPNVAVRAVSVAERGRIGGRPAQRLLEGLTPLKTSVPLRSDRRAIFLLNQSLSSSDVALEAAIGLGISRRNLHSAPDLQTCDAEEL